MRVAADFAIRVAARQQSQFAMRFQSHQAVIHLHARFLQAARPANVGGLVEARLQLHHDGDFLFGGRFHQRAHDRRIFAGAVQSLLDGKHVGILRGALDEAHHRRIGIVRVMQQHVALAEKTEQSVRLVRNRQLLRRQRREI